MSLARLIIWALAIVVFAQPFAWAASERKVDPTFLYRSLADVEPKVSDLTTATCRYKPLFGAGDSEKSIVRGVARYGEMTVEPAGRSSVVNYPDEEQVYFVLEGKGILLYGEEEVPIREEDFVYLPPGVDHGVANSSNQALRLIVMGFHMPKDKESGTPIWPLMANASQARKQVVGNHPPSTLFQLLMGATSSKRDLIAAGHLLTSLFIMEFSPGGTNHPHHHPNEEEIYLVLDGEGEMVAGGGMNGVEGRHPAKPGDAYFFRLNCTVGFYADSDPAAPKARILAVRSLYPR
jgi:mannose-6-phosphate isomerase-like protein (cupin superfamily)